MTKIVDDLARVKKWLKTNAKPDDPVPSKSQDRVLTSIAKGIRNNPGLPSGPCNLCSREMERLAPVILKVCPNCARKFNYHGGNIPVIKKEFVDCNCDFCLGRTFTAITINPHVCLYCSNKLGRKHKFDLVDMRKERVKFNKKAPWRK